MKGSSQPEHPRFSIRPTILVADDEPGIRESFELLLNKDYNLYFAADGEETLEIITS